MNNITELSQYYQNQLADGKMQKAYRSVMEAILQVRNHLEHRNLENYVSGLYPGYMDISYFSFTPQTLQDRKLRLAVVFKHQEFQFELWLTGVNKDQQKEYWNLLMEHDWTKYPLVPQVEGNIAITYTVVEPKPDFSDTAAVAEQIGKQAIQFLQDIETFLNTVKKE